MRQKKRLTFSAFCITALLIVALCGFVAVDLSTDRYMPGRFGPLMQISSISEAGVYFSFMGDEYFIDPQPLEQAKQVLHPYRGLLPARPRIVQALTIYIEQLCTQYEQENMWNE